MLRGKKDIIICGPKIHVEMPLPSTQGLTTSVRLVVVTGPIGALMDNLFGSVSLNSNIYY